MIVYNVTMKVEWSIEENWRQWMLDYYIPGIIATGHFYKYQFVRLLDIDEAEGPTYAVQYYATSLDDYNGYERAFAMLFKTELLTKWGYRCLFFTTLMEVLN